MTTTRAAIEQALAAGPTDGPWIARQEFANRWRIEQVAEDGFIPLSVGLACTTILEVGVTNHNTAANAGLMASCNPAAIRQLLADHDAEKKALEDELVRVRERFGKVLVAIDDAWANYERMGEVCPFEGQPMIYAATLEEIHNVAIDAALSPTTTNKKES